MGDAVGEDVLAVGDLSRIGEAREQGPLRDSKEQAVAAGHRTQKRYELEVLNQIIRIRRQIRPAYGVASAWREGDVEGEVLVFEHQVRFHGAIRFFKAP